MDDSLVGADSIIAFGNSLKFLSSDVTNPPAEILRPELMMDDMTS